MHAYSAQNNSHSCREFFIRILKPSKRGFIFAWKAHFNRDLHAPRQTNPNSVTKGTKSIFGITLCKQNLFFCWCYRSLICTALLSQSTGHQIYLQSKELSYKESSNLLHFLYLISLHLALFYGFMKKFNLFYFDCSNNYYNRCKHPPIIFFPN